MSRVRSNTSKAMNTIRRFTDDVKDKTKLKRTSGTTEDATGLVFGAPLKPFAADIPVVLKSVVEYFNFYGVAYEGLFRLSGSQNEIFQYRSQYDVGEVPDLINTCKDPHVAAGLLKLWLRSLPQPLCTYELYDCFLAAGSVPQEVAIQTIKKVLTMLPLSNRITIKYLFKFLHKISLQAEVNKMTPANIAIVFSVNVFRPEGDLIETQLVDSTFANKLVEIMVIHAETIFKGEPDAGNPLNHRRSRSVTDLKSLMSSSSSPTTTWTAKQPDEASPTHGYFATTGSAHSRMVQARRNFEIPKRKLPPPPPPSRSHRGDLSPRVDSVERLSPAQVPPLKQSLWSTADPPLKPNVQTPRKAMPSPPSSPASPASTPSHHNLATGGTWNWQKVNIESSVCDVPPPMPARPPPKPTHAPPKPPHEGRPHGSAPPRRQVVPHHQIAMNLSQSEPRSLYRDREGSEGQEYDQGLEFAMPSNTLRRDSPERLQLQRELFPAGSNGQPPTRPRGYTTSGFALVGMTGLPQQ